MDFPQVPAMETEDWLDSDLFDAFLRDISEGGSTAGDESEELPKDAGEWNAGVEVVTSKLNNLDAFHSSKDNRTLAKIRRQDEQRGNGDSDFIIVKKRKKSTRGTWQAPRPRLVVFPDFEKCDSLIYFPHTMARLVNSTDKLSLARLLNSYFAKSCEVQFSSEFISCTVPYKRLPDFIELAWETSPDYLMCVHDTKVVDNVICASTYFKYTECKFITDSVRSMTKDPLSLELLESPMEKLKRGLRFETKTEDEQKDISAILDSGRDVVVYGRVDMTVTFDPCSKKVVALGFAMHLTSVSLSDAISM
jgi:hypothetical protein